MTSKISKSGWIWLYVITGFIDFVQIVLFIIGLFTGVPLAINAAMDPFVGAGLITYFQFFGGVNMVSRIDRLISLLGLDILEEITGGVAPFWVADIWYIQRSVKKEDAEIEAQEKEQNILQQNGRRPLYSEGIRAPSNQEQEINKPANQNGIRPPGGGLVSNPK